MNNPKKSGAKMSGHPSHIPMAGRHPAGIAKGRPSIPVTKEEAISRIPFFKDLTKQELKRIAPYFHEYRFDKNRYLFLESEPANRFFVIKSGRVKLVKTSASGKEMVLEVMVPGQICGGNALFGEMHRNGAQAVEATIAYGMSRESYEDLLSTNPNIAKGIIKYLLLEK